MKNQFSYGYTTKEIDEIFEKHDKDKDGKLMIEDFIRMILPADYVIEEREDPWVFPKYPFYYQIIFKYV